MANKMIKCKTCGTEIAANAKVCPSCGAKNKKPFFRKPIFWIFVIIVVAIIGAVSSGSNEPEIDYSKPDFIVTADEIMSQYSENSVTAQEKYGGKVVCVTGKISSISEYTVSLEGDDDENWLTDIVLSLASGQNDVIKSISKGMKITATGKCDNTDFFDDIELKQVKIDTKGIEVITTEKTEPQATEENVIIDVDIDDLIEDYDSNSVSADEKYKDKTIRVRGRINSIEDGYIKLESTDEWVWDNVYAYYNSDEDVKSLKKGEKVTVTGVCKGEDIFSTIEIKKCTVEK